MKSLKYICIYILIGLIPLSNIPAQKKENLSSLTITIVNEKDNPISNAKIYSAEGKFVAYTDISGKAKITSSNKDNILIEANGFESLTIPASSIRDADKITLSTTKYLAGKKDYYLLPFGKQKKNLFTGAVTQIDIEKVKQNFSSSNYYSLLRSEGFGIIGTRNIRGNGATIIIDGFVRDGDASVSALSDLINTSEIETISVLKDAGSRLMYGSLSDGGIIMITTKSGEADKRKINVQYEGSAGYALEYPKYLDASNYMILYNEARRNDGLVPKYTEDDIKDTRNNVDPVKYPNHDYFSETFLRTIKPQHRLVTEFSGGNSTAQYYLNMGWYNTNSIQQLGQADNLATNRINVRGKIDVKVNDFIKVDVGALAYFNSYEGANYNGQNFWALSTSERPNAYPFLIPVDRVIAADSKIIEDARNQKSLIYDEYLLGGSSTFTQNIYGDLLLGGYNNTIDRNSQLNIGIDVDLKSILNGLKFRTHLGYDNYNAYRQTQRNTYAVYEPTFLPDDSISVKAIGVNRFTGGQSIGGVSFYRRMSWANTLNYNKIFDNIHYLDVTALSLISTYKQNMFLYTEKAANFGLRANYAFDNKYIIETTNMLVGSPRFSKNKRWGFSPSVGLGWILTEEEFLNNIEGIEFLKVKSSFGNTKTDLDAALSTYYMYQNVYNMGSAYNYGDGMGQNNSMSVQTGNTDISWVERNEFNVGVEASVLNRLLSFEFNYFESTRFNEIARLANTYPQFMGGNDFIAYQNYSKRTQKGFEADIALNKQFKDFKISIDFNVINLVPTRLVLDELDYGAGYEYRQRTGKVNDGIWGLVADGLYTQEEIDKINDPLDTSIPKPSFGAVQAGDIKYVDVDGDKVIDEKDIKLIGNSQARFNYGLRINLTYKNFNLFVFGLAETGFYRFNNNSYNWVYGENKYPEHVINRWAYDPILGVDTRETATYPRLTTLNNNNNFRNSTFWITKRDYFSIPAVQLTYNLSKMKDLFTLKELSVYARVENLITLSADKYANLNVGSSPQLRMYFLGIKADF
ncbi:MAG: SusC/RagA family TonB-linked outer membrane protein [Pigmentiphaga sp.]|nr:SusC/RagA family TonB-linked outer membrane protein [Pigmentiphaga sp.]